MVIWAKKRKVPLSVYPRFPLATSFSDLPHFCFAHIIMYIYRKGNDLFLRVASSNQLKKRRLLNDTKRLLPPKNHFLALLKVKHFSLRHGIRHVLNEKSKSTDEPRIGKLQAISCPIFCDFINIIHLKDSIVNPFFCILFCAHI